MKQLEANGGTEIIQGRFGDKGLSYNENKQERDCIIVIVIDSLHGKAFSRIMN